MQVRTVILLIMEILPVLCGKSYFCKLCCNVVAVALSLLLRLIVNYSYFSCFCYHSKFVL